MLENINILVDRESKALGHSVAPFMQLDSLIREPLSMRAFNRQLYQSSNPSDLNGYYTFLLVALEHPHYYSISRVSPDPCTNDSEATH